MVTAKTDEPKLTKKDFQSDQEVRWCPGCGDYVILATVQKLLPELGIPRHNTVFVSGIGCSSRFPYYMNTYGFHTIHGRAPAIATGLKLANPALTVWLVTGDGDGLSIGGNHLAHVLRRNLDVNIMLFNNRIYGLTKGQYSPTSEVGKKTKSTPMGSVDAPFVPAQFALGAGATFVARALDSDPKHLAETLRAAQAHRGTSFVEILQNCPVFNDGAWTSYAEKSSKLDRLLPVAHGEPLCFGGASKKAIRLGGPNRFTPEVFEVDRDGPLSDALIYDESDPLMPQLLAQLDLAVFPLPIGVFRRAERPSFELQMRHQMGEAHKKRGPGRIHDLLRSGETWRIE